MQPWLVVFIGGGAGSLARFYLSSALYQYLGKSFPYGILIVNVVGCLMMGFLAILLFHKFGGDGILRPALLVGFLGGFTTFSSFSLDALEMLQEGHIGKGVLYIGLSVVLCLIATAVGAWLAERL